MDKVTLYQKDRKGEKTKVWHIQVNDKRTQSEIVIQSGQLGGKLITNTAIVSQGKNIGKANETTHYTQAVSEANAKIELKKREGYVENLEDAVASTVLRDGFRQPMLAQKYDPTGKQKGSKTLAQMKIEGEKIFTQPKYDGNRCVPVLTKDGVVLRTRKGDVMPVQIEHIVRELNEKAAILYPDGVEGEIELDGELFSDEVSFNTLNGALKKQKNRTAEHERAIASVKLHLYDIMTDDGYEVRKETIKPFASKSIEIVPTKEIIATDENILEVYEEYIAEGHEGLMIRLQGKPYENKRTWQLVKFKSFEDAEFKLIGYEEDVRGGFIGTFILELPEPATDRDGKIVTDFRAGASGQSVDERKEMLANFDNYKGKMATVEYFGWDVRPRFPKFRGIREDI